MYAIVCLYIYSAARERFAAVIEWLDDFNEKCPKKSTKKQNYSALVDVTMPYEMKSYQAVELQELRDEVEELRVELPQEVKRIDEVERT